MFNRKKRVDDDSVFTPAAKASKSTSEKPSSPFLRAQAGEQDDRYMNLAVARHNDRVEKRILYAILAMSVAFNGYYMMSSKFIPYVVETDRIGNIITVGPADRANPVDNKRVIREQMVSWVENARLIVGDQAAGKRFQKWVYARVQEGSAAKTALDRFYADRKPFETAADHTVDAQVTLCLPVSDNTFQIEWTETLHAPNGAELGKERWKGVFTYKIVPLNTEAAIRVNGAGFFVTEFTWSKVLG
ncbi:type IV secretion system protein VirB5 [Paraburkholderia sp. BL8N3]|nr:type IV secretion system protein VirB5 [Paraburkholderia sp. BL8N3]